MVLEWLVGSVSEFDKGLYLETKTFNQEEDYRFNDLLNEFLWFLQSLTDGEVLVCDGSFLQVFQGQFTDLYESWNGEESGHPEIHEKVIISYFHLKIWPGTESGPSARP